MQIYKDSPLLSPRNIAGLGFTFSSMNCFELIVGYGMDWSLFSAQEYLISPTPLKSRVFILYLSLNSFYC